MAVKAFKREAVRKTLPRRGKLTTEQIDALRLIKDGADITSWSLAKTLRAIEKHRPELLTIGTLHGGYNPLGPLPYFGAILTAKGKRVIR